MAWLPQFVSVAESTALDDILASLGWGVLAGVIAGLISGVVASFLASWLFKRYLLAQKPKVDLSPKIAKWRRRNGLGFHYAVRIRNASLKVLFDLRFEAQLVKEEHNEGVAAELYTRIVPLTKAQYFSLDPFNAELGRGVITLRLKTQAKGKRVELEELLGEYDYLRIRIFATDAETGTSDVLSARYRRDDIAFGRYLPYSLDVQPSLGSETEDG